MGWRVRGGGAELLPEVLGLGLGVGCVGRRSVAAYAIDANWLGHIEQAYGFSPVWVCSCRATALLVVNRRGHMEQACSMWLLASVAMLSLVRRNMALLGEAH